MTTTPTLVQLKTANEARREDIVLRVEQLLEDAKAGNVRQIFIAYEDETGNGKSITFSHSRWELMGLVFICLQGMAFKVGEDE